MLQQVRTLEKKLGVEPFRFDHFPEDPIERGKCIRAYLLSLSEKVKEQSKQRRCK